MKQFVSILFLAFIFQQASAEGIQFEKGSFKEALAKAKAENKMIYLDVFTTWCGPCKIMAKKYFGDDEVGKYYNSKFICYSIDAEKGEGIEVAKTYKVNAYPTNLFLHPKDGSVVYQISGCPADVDGFMEYGKTGLLEYADPMKMTEYETMFQGNHYNEAFLRKYIEKLNRRNERNDKQVDAFITNYANTLGKDSALNYLIELNESMNCAIPELMIGAKMFEGDEEKYKEEMERRMYHDVDYAIQQNDKGYYYTALAKYKKILPQEKEKHLFFDTWYFDKTDEEETKWNAKADYCEFMAAIPNKEYEKQDAKMLEDNIKSMTWQIKMNSPKELKESEMEEIVKKNIAARPEIQHSKSAMASNTLNTAAWDAFEKKRDDPKLLSRALIWSKKAVELTQYTPKELPAVQDTYACLLYANGQKAEAITMEESIIKSLQGKASAEEIKGFQETVEKMKANTL